VHFDTHEKARKVGRRRVFLPLSADSRQDYVTACVLFPAQSNDERHKRNENFTNIGNFSYEYTRQVDGISPTKGYQ
jgi:hypothetical protein